MPGKQSFDRRRFLELTGATTTAAILAGCGGPGGNGDGGNGGGNGDEDTEMEAETETEGGNETEGETTTEGGDNMELVEGYLEDTDNYDSVEDQTGSDQVTVLVGAEGNGGNFAFEPPAISVDSGTEVVWEWTGEGGTHNVVHEDGEFQSELKEEEGATFSYTLEEARAFLYFCEPHRSVGMKGAVIVEE